MNLGVSFAPLVPAYVVWAAFGVAVADLGRAVARAQPRRAGARARAGADGAGARQSLADARGPRPDPLGRRRRRRQEPEPGFRRPQRSRPRQRARRSSSGSAAFPASRCASPKPAHADGETDGTRLFSALSSTLADVPPDRVAGAIMITDGRVHDVPAEAAALGFDAPLHALITGHANEIDRRVVLDADAALRHRRPVADRSASASRTRARKAGTAQVTVRRDGEMLEQRIVHVGAERQGQGADPARRAEHRRDRGRAARRTSSRKSTTARWSRSTACATSCACCWSPASRMPASAPGATC